MQSVESLEPTFFQDLGSLFDLIVDRDDNLRFFEDRRHIRFLLRLLITVHFERQNLGRDKRQGANFTFGQYAQDGFSFESNVQLRLVVQRAVETARVEIGNRFSRLQCIIGPKFFQEGDRRLDLALPRRLRSRSDARNRRRSVHELAMELSRLPDNHVSNEPFARRPAAGTTTHR